MSLCTVFLMTGTYIHNSELFAAAVLCCRQEIKYVGVCRDVQEPVRDSDIGGYLTVEKELTCKCELLSSTSLCLYYVCKTLIHNMCLSVQFPYMYPSLTYTRQLSQQSNSDLIYDPGEVRPT